MNNQKNSYSVYIHICPNGKRYIGATGIKPEYRWNRGEGYKKHEKFYADIKKYGWNNIEHQIVFSGLSKEEAAQREIELIEKYKSNEDAFGYNRTAGGFCLCGKGNPFYDKHHTEETRKVMSEKWEYEKHFSPETIEKLRNASAGENNPLYGKHHSEESKRKNMISQKGRKEVRKYSLTGEYLGSYLSIREAARDVMGDKRHISVACREDRVAYGYKWKFA